MKTEKKNKIIEIKEEIIIKQDDKKIILEKGDRIKILEDLFESQFIDLTDKEINEFIKQANTVGQFIHDLKIIDSQSVRGYKEFEVNFNEVEIKKNRGILLAIFDRMTPQLREEIIQIRGQQYHKLRLSIEAHKRGSSKYDSVMFEVLTGYFNLSSRSWTFARTRRELLH